MKFTTAVLFDTSALRDAGWTSAPLLTLLELSKAGLVEVCLPELVTQERRTQWRERPKLALEAAREALQELAEDAIIPSNHAENVTRALAALDGLDIEEISKDALRQFVRANRIQVLPITFDQTKSAWAAYFAGAPPFRKAKARDDIPDAHIFASASALLEKHGEVLFVCADKGLSTALSNLRGSRVYATLEELFQSGALEDVKRLWERDADWRRVEHLVSHEKITGAVQSVLEFDLWELLVGRTLKDDILPGNQVATVLWTLGAELIQIQKPDDWGGGIMSFEVDFETDANIMLLLTPDDVRKLPSWMDISCSPVGTQIEVTAKVRLKVEATVDVEVDLENAESGEEPLLSKTGFDDGSVSLFIIPT